jgi:TRAP-type C4-dicarboxylate transport system permease small subunit
MAAQTPLEETNPAGIYRAARALEAVVAVVSKSALVLAGLTTASIFALICYSVGMRYFLGQPKPWVDEAVGWLLVVSVMLALPEVQRRGDHIGIDFLQTRISDSGRRFVLIFGLLTVFASAVILVVEGIEMVEFSRMIGVLSNQIPEVPLWLVQAFVPIGFALLMLVAGTQIICLTLGLRPRDMAETVHGEPT